VKLKSTPRLKRGLMMPLRWAAHPLLRVLRRLLGYLAPEPWRDPVEYRPIMLRRLVLLALVVAGGVTGTQTMAEILPQHGTALLERGMLVLFFILFGWISAGFWTAVMGAVVMLGANRRSITRVLDEPGVRDAALPADARTAIVMPICNEDVTAAFAGLRATWESLAATGQGRRFDFYVLSDTNKADIRAAELTAYSELRKRTLAAGRTERCPVYYRWRAVRTKRKAGNIADFCRRFGRKYVHMVVLDADSVMTGECLTNLVRLMLAHPDAGIIQTAPRGCGHETLHARALQFSSRLYGPLFTAGMHYWQLGESHYWGHNAILRIEPFMKHCALSDLPGRGSMSGEIMSHDFVEAALMRRAGWKVWLAWDLEGSFEQLPPNLIAELQRDRRWCHGNLQNSRLMFEPGLHMMHRSVFATGLLAYLSSPLWLGFLLLSSILFSSQGQPPPQSFGPYQLFPLWPGADRTLVLTLFGATASLLFGPKVLALLMIVLRGQARAYGGVPRLVASAVLELGYSMLLAPVRMMFHCQFIFAAFSGWKFDWQSPPRDGTSTPWLEALRRHGPHTLFALAWIGALYASGSQFAWWLMPVIGSLLVAPALSVWASRVSIGRAMRRARMLLIPEEHQVPTVLVRAQQLVAAAGEAPGLVDAMRHPALLRPLLAALPERPEASGLKAKAERELLEHAALVGPDELSPGESLRLVDNAPMLAELGSRVASGETHPAWRVDADPPLGVPYPPVPQHPASSGQAVANLAAGVLEPR
jgi:membrane glycosyltransferase